MCTVYCASPPTHTTSGQDMVTAGQDNWFWHSLKDKYVHAVSETPFLFIQYWLAVCKHHREFVTKHHHPTYVGLSLSDTETSDYGQWVLLYCMSMAKGTQLECWLASCMHCRLHRLVCTLVQYFRWMVLQETGGLQSHLLMVPDSNSIVCWLTP